MIHAGPPARGGNQTFQGPAWTYEEQSRAPSSQMGPRWDMGEGESGLIRAIRHRSVEFAHALAGADFSSAASFRFFLVSTWSNRSLSADQLRIWLSPIVPGLCAKYRPISITLQINSALCSAPIVMPEACIPRVSPTRRGVNRQQDHDRFGPYQSEA